MAISNIVSLKRKSSKLSDRAYAAPTADDFPTDGFSLRKPPVGDSHPLRSELRFVAHELQHALEEAQLEADWHRQALHRAEERTLALRRHLTPLLDDEDRLNLDATVKEQPIETTSETALEPLQLSRSTSGDLPANGLQTRWAFESNSAIELEALCPASEATLRIHCLGPFRVWHGGRWVEDWPSLRGQAILRYLAAHRPSPVSRDILMDTFWPSADPESARRNLHQAIYSLRLAFREESAGDVDGRSSVKSKACSHAPVLFEYGHYSLNPGFHIWIDWEEFEQRVQAARRSLAAGLLVDAALELSFAMELYRGDLLEEANFEDWVLARRTALRNLFLEAADWLGGYFYDLKEYASAVSACARMLELDRCNERAHCRLMQCFREQGLRAAAIRQYHTCRQALRDELGVSPASDTQALFKELLREAGTAD